MIPRIASIVDNTPLPAFIVLVNENLGQREHNEVKLITLTGED